MFRNCQKIPSLFEGCLIPAVNQTKCLIIWWKRWGYFSIWLTNAHLNAWNIYISLTELQTQGRHWAFFLLFCSIFFSCSPLPPRHQTAEAASWLSKWALNEPSLKCLISAMDLVDVRRKITTRILANLTGLLETLLRQTFYALKMLIAIIILHSQPQRGGTYW